jgi:hypothetical protein
MYAYMYIYIYTYTYTYVFFLQSLGLYLEFIQHHINMGVSHIFITVAFAWGGEIMNKLLRIFRTYIEDGSVTITSHTDGDR